MMKMKVEMKVKVRVEVKVKKSKFEGMNNFMNVILINKLITYFIILYI